MNARLDNPLTEADPLLRGVLITTLAIAAIGMLLLVRASFGGGVDHVTVRVDNQAALVLQVDTIDPSGARVGLGSAAPRPAPPSRRSRTSAHAGRLSPPTGATRCTG